MTDKPPTNSSPVDDPDHAAKLAYLRTIYLAGRPTRYFVRPFLLAIMVTALIVGLLSVIVTITHNRIWLALAPLCFLISLEAIYTTNWLHHPRQISLDRTMYRAAEILLLFILLRMSVWFIFSEGFPNAARFEQYLRAPQELFLDSRFLLTIALAGITWIFSVFLSRTLARLEINEFELRYYSTPLSWRKRATADKPIQISRGALLQGFMNLWLWGGILLIGAVGISTIEQQSVEALMTPLAAGRTSLEPHVLAALLIYFISGLWLLSQARLMHTNARWLINDVTADKQTQRIWQRSSLVLLLVVLVLAAFIPIGSTTAGSQIVQLLLSLLVLLANLLIFLITAPIAFLMSFFSRGQTSAAESLPLMPPPIEFTPGPSQPSILAEVLAMIASSGFWAIFLVAAALALLFFLRERKARADGKQGQPFLRSLMLWLKDLWQTMRGQARALQQSLSTLLEPAEIPPAAPRDQSRWRFVRVSGLSPRDQIRYFYLSTVRRAGDRGVKRPAIDTPLEYLQDLKEHWPEAEEALDELTEAFLKARYSDKPIESEDIPAVKDTWKEVRRELKQHSSDKPDNDQQAPTN